MIEAPILNDIVAEIIFDEIEAGLGPNSRSEVFEIMTFIEELTGGRQDPASVLALRDYLRQRATGTDSSIITETLKLLEELIEALNDPPTSLAPAPGPASAAARARRAKRWAKLRQLAADKLAAN